MRDGGMAAGAVVAALLLLSDQVVAERIQPNFARRGRASQPASLVEVREHDRVKLTGGPSELDKEFRPKFLKNLYSFLKSLNNCFYRGAFVALAPPQGFGDRLKAYGQYEELPSFLRSHLAYWNDTSSKDFYEVTFKKPFEINCTAKLGVQPMESMKYYFFQVGGKQAVYFKLEDHPTKTLAHVWEAFKVYLLKWKQTDLRTGAPYRAENLACEATEDVERSRRGKKGIFTPSQKGVAPDPDWTSSSSGASLVTEEEYAYLVHPSHANPNLCSDAYILPESVVASLMDPRDDKQRVLALADVVAKQRDTPLQRVDDFLAR